MLSLKSVRDDDLLRQLFQLVKQSRGVEAEVVAHIGEVELRRLYAQAACSSMFEYCRRVLLLRENEAYLRITVARAARENPVLLEMLHDGRLHLSGIARLAPHLTRQNAEAVLKRASGMSHREIRELVCELEPRPDVATSVRRLPQRPASGSGSSPLQLGAPRVEPDAVNVESDAFKLESRVAAPARPPVVEPLHPAATWSASLPAPSSARSSIVCKPSCVPRCPTLIWRESSTSPSPRSCSASRRSVLARQRHPGGISAKRTHTPRRVTSPPR